MLENTLERIASFFPKQYLDMLNLKEIEKIAELQVLPEVEFSFNALPR